VSTDNPAQWLRQQSESAAMKDLWRILLRDAWGERLELALSDVDSLTLESVLFWAAGNDPVFSTALSKLMAEAGEATPGEANGCLADISSLSPRQSDPGAQLLGKLQSIAEDRGLDLLDLLAEAKASRNLLSFIQKNATKSMKYEKTAAAYIELRRPKVRVLQLADKSTKLSVRFDRDGNARINTPASKEKYSKDADLAAILRTSADAATVFLISHKFARVGGGHQDNQWVDASQFLEYACQNPLEADSPRDQIQELAGRALDAPGIRVSWEPALILDGEFFAGAPNRMSSTFRGRPCFVGDTDAFVSHLDHRAGPGGFQ
jgi:hypothetical protein